MTLKEKARLVRIGARLIGAVERPGKGWVYYDDSESCHFAVSAASVALAGRMHEDGEWDYSEWCAAAPARRVE